MALDLLPLYVLLVLAATAVDPPAARRIAYSGLVAFALGVAAYGVNPGSDDLAEISRAAAGSTDAFFRVNTGFLLLGIAAFGVAAAHAFRHGSPGAPGRALGLLAVGAYGLWGLRAVIQQSGGWRPVLAALFLGLVLLLAGFTADRFRARGAPPHDQPTDWPGAKSGSLPLAGAFAVGVLAVLAGPHAGLVFSGLALAAWADFWDRRRRGVARFPWLALASLIVLPVWWFMATVAGPVGLELRALADVPFSVAAERLLALPLGLIAWAFLGLWPTRSVFPGGLLAPLGIALWLRVAAPAVADGIDHWQPLLVPLGLAGLWGAALTGWAAGVCNALAFVALASDALTSVPAAIVLGATGLAFRIAPVGSVRGAAERLAWMLAALVLPFTFEAGFRAQVTYTLLAGLGTALACWTSLGSHSHHDP